MRTDMMKLRLSALAVLLCLTSLSAFGVFFPWPTTPTTVTWYFNPANWPSNLTQANIVAALQAAADEWPQQAGAPIHLVYGGTTTLCGTHTGQNIVCNDGALPANQAIADTYDWADASNHLTEFDQVWHGGYSLFPGTTGCSGSGLAQYLQSAAAHEMGHAYGLQDSTVTTAVMFKPWPTNCDLRGFMLTADDLAGIAALYPGASAPPAGCPVNQTVTGTSSSGAVVMYILPMVTQTGTPASGSTFPIGTTPVTFAVGPGCPAISVTVTPPPPPGTGSLAGTVLAVTSPVNLTTVGTSDWIHWSGPQRKATGGSQISNYTLVHGGTAATYGNDPRTLSWSDGTPTTSGSNPNGVYMPGIGNGFQITVPADTTTRTATIYVGGWLSSGQLTATLSDGSASAYTSPVLSGSGQYDGAYSLTYTAGATGQHLTATWTQTAGGGNVTLQGVALAGGSAPAAPAPSPAPTPSPTPTPMPTGVPATPTAFAVETPTAATGTITLSWPAVSLATSYQVFRSAPLGTPYALKATVSTTTWTDPSPVAGVLNGYQYVACNVSGCSSPSPSNSTTGPPPPPAVPPVPITPRVIAVPPPPAGSTVDAIALVPYGWTQNGALPVYLTDSYISPQFVGADTGYTAESFGTLALRGTIYGPYLNPATPPDAPIACSSAYTNYVDIGLAQDGYLKSAYRTTAQIAECATANSVEYSGSRVFLAGGFGTFPHEFGHTLGFVHAHTLNCVDSVTGRHIPINQAGVATQTCTTNDYGDPTNTMGQAAGGTTFNGSQKLQIGWLPSTSVKTVDATQHGTQTIALAPVNSATPTGTLMVRVLLNGSPYLDLDFRSTLSSGDAATSPYYKGLEFRSVQSSVDYALMDLTPSASPAWSAPTLVPGQSFTDPQTSMVFTTVNYSQSPWSATLQVMVP